MAATLPLWRRPPIPFALFLCAVFGFAVFFELGRMDVVSDNEGQRAAPPVEMLRTGDYVVPTINGETYLAKPPLLYWAIVPFYHLSGGPNALAARLPGALCALGLFVSVYLFLRTPMGETHAQWAALMTGIAPYVLERARWSQLDIPLTFALFLAIATLQFGRRSRRNVLLAGVACGAAMLLKGPVVVPFLWAGWVASVLTGDTDRGDVGRYVWWTAGAMVLDFVLRGIGSLTNYGGVLTFPWGLLIVLGLWTWCAGRVDWRGDRRFVRWLGAAAIGVVCLLPWALLVLREVGGEYVGALLVEQVLDRTHTASKINSGSSFYFFAGAPLMLAPWGLLMPALLSGRLWRSGGAPYRFCALFGGVSVAAFSLFAGKEYEYILPAVPFWAAAIALVWLHDGDYGDWRALNVWVRLCKAALPTLLAVIALGVAVYFSATNPRPLLLIEIWVVVGAAVLAWRAVGAGPGPRRLAVAAFTGILIAFVARSYHYTGARSPRELIGIANRLQASGYTVEASKMYPAFAFYADAHIEELQDVDALAEKLAGEAPYFYLTRTEILAGPLQEIPAEDRQLLAGPYTSKNHVLIGNGPLPERL